MKSRLWPIVLLVSILAVNFHPTYGTPNLYISPGQTAYLQGQQFTITVNVGSISNLAGFDITLSYNPAVLAGIAPTLQGSLITQQGLAYFVFVNRTDNAAGTVRLALSILGGATLGTTANPASGILYSVRFRVASTGVSSLNLANDNLLDNNGNNITHTTANGSFDNTHNIRVSSVVSQKTAIGQGFLGNILVSVSNLGTSSETITTTAKAGTSTIQAKSFSLPPGASTTITFTWNTSSFLKGNYTVSASASIAAIDADPTDNSLTDGTVRVTVPGDIDGNCLVNIDDILKASTVWGATPSSTNWYPNADINNNQAVDVDDILTIVVHWGTHC